MENLLVTGEVVEGNKLGRKLGFPTVNIPVPNGYHGRDGVYAGIVDTGSEQYRAMISIGTRPSVTDSRQRILEAHLFGFSGDLYGRTITVIPEHYIREELKFPSVEELQKQISADRETVLRYYQ